MISPNLACKIAFALVILTVGRFAEPLGSCQDSPPGRGKFDGPAELPRIYLQSSLSSTPAPGSVIQVHSGDNLQKTIDGAKCGDTLMLEPGAAFRGVFRFPAKACDDSHWIIVRTGSPDQNLPVEGERVTPCYAGIASLPGRPDFHCVSLRNVMAKLDFDGDGDSGPIVFLSHANHYRFIGLEVTRAKPQFHVRNLIQPDRPEDTAEHLIFDRMWIHGAAQEETKGGIHLSGTTYVAIVDSYFSDFHCIARKGSCTDAQAINGGGGDSPGGPYKIVNNFLEASGESILFGGAPGSATPADIEIRHNHLFKPLVWKTGEPAFLPSYTGDPYIVKNNFELKNAQRVLFEGNLLENCWGGFTQKGFSIVLTPVNQGGKCPECRVTDVTIRYNLVRHAGGVLDIANVEGSQKASATAGERYSIHDLIADDISGDRFNGTGLFVLVMSVNPTLKDVRIDHITAFPQRAVLSIFNQGSKVDGFSISNSMFTSGTRQMIGAGGGPQNCARMPDGPNSIVQNCFSGSAFANNLVIGGDGGWPHGTLVLKDLKDAGIIESGDGSASGYRLCSSKDDAANCAKPSPAVAKGSDGRDIGADLNAVAKTLAGVN